MGSPADYATGKTSVLLAWLEKKHKHLRHRVFRVHLHREKINLKNFEPFENLAKNVNDVLHINLVGPLTLSPEKNNYILLLMCQFSRFVSAVPIPDISLLKQSLQRS